MFIDRREFMKTGTAFAAGQSLGVHNAMAAPAASPAGVARAVGRMAWAPASWYRPYTSLVAWDPSVVTWVQIDLGVSRAIDSIRLYPAFAAGSEHANGFGFPARFRIEASSDESLANPVLLIDQMGSDFAELGDQILEFATAGAFGRYVRLTATGLRPAKEQLGYKDDVGYKLALYKMDVISGGKDVAERCAVTADPIFGNPKDLGQLTRPPRPMGEGIFTDNPGNVLPTSEWRRVPYLANAPRSGVSVEHEHGLFRRAMENNITYLLTSFSVDEMLQPYRVRAGKPTMPRLRKPIEFWETGEHLGHCAGRFLMGAGNTLRWIEHPELRSWMDAIVGGIAECRQDNGYILGFPEEMLAYGQRAAVNRSWVTHGLIEAGYAGNPKAFSLLRGFYDWFDRNPSLPQLMRGGEQGIQGMIPSARMYFTPVGKPEDIQVVQRYYQENYWLDGLGKRSTDMVWQYPYDRPHNYLVTDLEAYLDLYRATGDKRYLDAMQGGWDLFHDHWEHVGGSIAITEYGVFPPGAYRLEAQFPFCETGETCGSVFWSFFNQRFQLMHPDQEKYANEIEKSIYNVLLANQVKAEGIIYHTRLVRMKGDLTVPLCTNSCCEGQGTRMIGALPEFIYSVAQDGLYVNLFEPSAIEWAQAGAKMKVALSGNFPMSPDVRLEVTSSQPAQARIRIRVPSWASGPMKVSVNRSAFVSGSPGSYVALDRLWRTGDTVQFTLPMQLKLSRYSGLDQIEGHERFALEYGPLLLALVGSSSAALSLPGGRRYEDILQRIQPDPHRPLHFTVAGHPEFVYRPYWQVLSEPFTCFPVIDLA